MQHLPRGTPNPPGVPNAPCGVESFDSLYVRLFAVCVPNAPCGVERKPLLLLIISISPRS